MGAESFTTYTPTLFFGKGFGDLPDSFGWMRAFGLTGQVGYAIPSSSASFTVDPDSGDVDIDRHPRFLNYGFSLQYSMPYLKSSVVDLGLPDFINRLVPIVEGSFQTPVGNNQGTGIGTTGTINPGVIWVGDYFPGRARGDRADQPRERHRGRRHGAAASLSRRPVSQIDRRAAVQHGRQPGGDHACAPCMLGVLLTLALSTAIAHAHAQLQRASPLVGSTVASAPSEVRLWFTQALEPKFTTAQLRSGSGAVVASGGVDTADPKQIVIRVPRAAGGQLQGVLEGAVGRQRITPKAASDSR